MVTCARMVVVPVTVDPFAGAVSVTTRPPSCADARGSSNKEEPTIKSRTANGLVQVFTGGVLSRKWGECAQPPYAVAALSHHSDADDGVRRRAGVEAGEASAVREVEPVYV